MIIKWLLWALVKLICARFLAQCLAHTCPIDGMCSYVIFVPQITVQGGYHYSAFTQGLSDFPRTVETVVGRKEYLQVIVKAIQSCLWSWELGRPGSSGFQGDTPPSPCRELHCAMGEQDHVLHCQRLWTVHLTARPTPPSLLPPHPFSPSSNHQQAIQRSPFSSEVCFCGTLNM